VPQPRWPARAAKFDEVLGLIEAARRRAYQAVNTELVGLYWQLGEYISKKIASAEWGDGIVDDLAATIARAYPGMRGFTRRNLFRMRQFYEAYCGKKNVSPLVTQLPWTHHLIILGQAKYAEEREFYMLAAIKGRWSKRELERQLHTGVALRSDGAAKKVSPAVARTHPAALDEFKNAYSIEFLGLSDGHSEADLHGALLRNLGRFITELGRDFCFVGSEYPVQVGKQDFAIDLVFCHRGLSCLVAFELKTEKFKPADLGQLSFYVEALDRDVKKRTSGRRSASCSARRRTTRSSSTRSHGRSRRRWSRSTRPCSHRKRSCGVSSTSSTRSSLRRKRLVRPTQKRSRPYNDAGRRSRREGGAGRDDGGRCPWSDREVRVLRGEARRERG